MGKGGAVLTDATNNEQTVAERRALRAQYRNLHAKAMSTREMLASTANTCLQDRLRELDSLRSRVEKPREHAVDAEVFADFTTCALDMARQGRAASQGRSPMEFLMILIQKHNRGEAPVVGVGLEDPEAFDWYALGEEVSGCFRTFPGVSCMLGPLSAEAKLRHAVQRKPKRQLAEVTAPDQLEAIQETEKQETDRNMEAMWRVLEGCSGPVPMSDLVCNHVSFAQTAENMFTLAFLVRDKRASFMLDPEVGVLVTPINPKDKEATAAAQQQVGTQTPLQFTVSFTMDDWELMKEVVTPEACLMPHRECHPQEAAAAPAAGGGEVGGQGAAKRRRS